MTGKAIVLRGNALNLPLPDESVDLIVTSPPYFALRSYQDGCPTCKRTPEEVAAGDYSKLQADCPECHGTGRGHYDGQIGSEPTPKDFLDALIAATAEMKRVLKPSGSIFVNLGDKYAGSGEPNNGARGVTGLGGKAKAQALQHVGKRRPNERGFPQKSLMLLPHRYAIRCVDELGLICRQDQVWSKPNGLPESVTDRTRRSHEFWFHFVKSPKYFSAVDEIREAHKYKTNGAVFGGKKSVGAGIDRYGENTYDEQNPLGKLPGSVWTIPTEPLKVPPLLGIDHFAAFPTEWPRRLILGWSPSGICVECHRPVVERKPDARENAQRKVPESPQGDGGVYRLWDDNGTPRPRPQGQDNGELPSLATEGPSHSAHHRGSDEVRREMRDLPHAPSLERGDETTPERAEAAPMLLREALGGEGDVQDALHEVAEARESSRQAQSGLCSCGPGTATTPALVLDPFMGTGTTLLVARALGRDSIGVDLSADYCRLAQWRIFKSGHGAKALSRTNLERQGELL